MCDGYPLGFCVLGCVAGYMFFLGVGVFMVDEFISFGKLCLVYGDILS